MAIIPSEEELAFILRDLKRYGALRPLAELLPVSYRTLDRHAESVDTASVDRPTMSETTRRELIRLFAKLEILEGYDLARLDAAVAELERRAATLPNADDVAAAEAGDSPTDGGEHGEGEGRVD